MTKATRRMLIGSIAAAGVVGITAVVDLIIGFPYSGQMIMDILFLLSACVVCYLGYDTYKELS